jgi:polyhydroxyalkanoate synthesis regulator phasin
MLEPLKKTLLATLGIIAFSKDRLQKLIHELVERGEITRDQGKRLFDHLAERGDAESQGLVERWMGELQALLGRSPVVSRSEFRSLAERVSALEGGASGAGEAHGPFRQTAGSGPSGPVSGIGSLSPGESSDR